MSLIRLAISDLPIGAPLPWAVYGKNGALLLSAGGIIHKSDAAELLDLGLFRHKDGEAGRSNRDLTADRTGLKPDLPGVSMGVENVQLGVREEGAKERTVVRVEFMGLISDTSMIVGQPQRDGKLLTIGVGQSVTVKMFVNRYVHAFVSQVLCAYKAPKPHMHLSYPTDIKSSLFRSSRRIVLRDRLLALLKMGQDVSVPVAITDISNRGVGVFSEYDLGEVGAAVRLSFFAATAEGGSSIRAEAVIRSTRAVKAQRGFQYGIELLDLKPEETTALECFIYEQL